MIAYPEKVDVEHVLRQKEPPRIGRPLQGSPGGEASSMSWRVVTADGDEKGTSNGNQPYRAANACKPGAVKVVETAGDRKPRHPAQRDAVAVAPDHRPARSVIPPQGSARCRDIDSQLARIIGVWPELPRSIQAAMLAMIDAVNEDR